MCGWFDSHRGVNCLLHENGERWHWCDNEAQPSGLDKQLVFAQMTRRQEAGRGGAVLVVPGAVSRAFCLCLISGHGPQWSSPQPSPLTHCPSSRFCLHPVPYMGSVLKRCKQCPEMSSQQHNKLVFTYECKRHAVRDRTQEKAEMLPGTLICKCLSRDYVIVSMLKECACVCSLRCNER